MRAETLGPWVFVNADRGAPPLHEQYGKVLDIIAQSGVDLDALRAHSREEWESAANWKTMLENFLECYHCAIAHPGFSAAIDVMPDNYNLAVHGWFSSQVGMVRQSALEGRSQVKIYDARGEVAQAQYHLLFPNMTININPGFPNLSIDVWWPNGPNGDQGILGAVFRARRLGRVRARADRVQPPGRDRGRRPDRFRAAWPARRTSSRRAATSPAPSIWSAISRG